MRIREAAVRRTAVRRAAVRRAAVRPAAEQAAAATERVEPARSLVAVRVTRGKAARQEPESRRPTARPVPTTRTALRPSVVTACAARASATARARRARKCSPDSPTAAASPPPRAWIRTTTATRKRPTRAATTEVAMEPANVESTERIRSAWWRAARRPNFSLNEPATEKERARRPHPSSAANTRVRRRAARRPAWATAIATRRATVRAPRWSAVPRRPTARCAKRAMNVVPRTALTACVATASAPEPARRAPKPRRDKPRGAAWRCRPGKTPTTSAAWKPETRAGGTVRATVAVAAGCSRAARPAAPRPALAKR